MRQKKNIYIITIKQTFKYSFYVNYYGVSFLSTNRFYRKRKVIDIEQKEQKLNLFEPEFKKRKNFTNFLERIYLDVINSRMDNNED